MRWKDTLTANFEQMKSFVRVAHNWMIETDRQNTVCSDLLFVACKGLFHVVLFCYGTFTYSFNFITKHRACVTVFHKTFFVIFLI